MSVDNDALRSLVREALRDALGGATNATQLAQVLSGSPAPAASASPAVVEMVSLASDSELNNFVHRILDMSADATTLNKLRQGHIKFQLANSAVSAAGTASGTTYIEKGAVTEATIRKAAESGSTVIVARKVVVTSLARDKARDLGVTITRESEQDNQKGSVRR